MWHHKDKIKQVLKPTCNPSREGKKAHIKMQKQVQQEHESCCLSRISILV